MSTRLMTGLLMVGCAAVVAAQAAAPDQAARQAQRFPLRLHVLAIDDVHKTVRLQPDWCSASAPDLAGDGAATCSNGSASLGGGEDDFSGAGRADLVTPPDGTAGLNFTYEGCSRVRVAPGFTGLEARWLKPGTRLQVLVPTDAIPDPTSVHTARCTLKVQAQAYVYLRLRTGAMLRVTQQAYQQRPALRVYLSGGSEALERRSNAVVSVDELAKQKQP